MDSQLLTPLNALDSSLTALVTSLTTSNTFSNAPSAARDLISADDALGSALATLKQHQENYARILKLRAEAERLQNQIKDIVKTCVELRREVGSIAPGILEEDSEEDHTDIESSDDKDQVTHIPTSHSVKEKRVDYKTLLSFAARIGKHNAVAAHEAEKESIRRKIQASHIAQQSHQSSSDAIGRPKLGSRTNTTTNGNLTDTFSGAAGAETAQGQIQDGPPAQDSQATTAESQAEVSRMNDMISSQRALAGMAFPAAELLRMGALGQLQLLRENQGEKAVDDEIERLVKESEGVLGPMSENDSKQGGEDEDDNDEDMDMEDIIGQNDTSGAQTTRPASSAGAVTDPTTRAANPAVAAGVSQTPRSGQQQQQAPQVRRKLDLDFPGSDDDDDDDDND